MAALADSAATRRAHAADWNDFRGWCGAAGRGALPASAETLGLYAVEVLDRGSVATCERRLAAHSLRAGCVTAAARAGAPVAAIMARTGHRSIGTVMQYVRPASAFDLDPLRGVL